MRVDFDQHTTIDFIDNETEIELFSIQPEDLKAIYAAYFLMEKENAELDSIKKRK